MTAGLLAAQALAEVEPPCPAADKWDLFRDLCAARAAFGVTDRDLTVLNALLSFHPGSQLTDGALIVFPSNAALSERAHAMAESTLRRHLAALVAAGLILRHDSPNGKRYCARGRSGEIERAFGFDLRPLLVRSVQIREAAGEARQAALIQRKTREEASLLLRDATKLAEYGQEQVPGDWDAVFRSLHEVRKALRRRLDSGSIQRIRDDLERMLREVSRRLESQEMDGNDVQIERHPQNSKPETPDLESCLEDSSEAAGAPDPEPPRLPFGLVRKACPEIALFSEGNLGGWPELVTAARRVAPMMGISPSALAEAETAMGPPVAAVTLACMLQRMDQIRSPGGYLRSLSRKAGSGGFSPGPMVMALLRDAA